MMSPAQWLADAAYHAPLPWVAAATIAWFVAIYVLVAGGASAFAIDRGENALTRADGRTRRMHPGRVVRDVLRSALSIPVLALQAAGRLTSAA